MIEYGDKVTHIRTGKVGEVIGFMRGPDKYLVKFEDDEMWLTGRVLKKEDDHDEG